MRRPVALAFALMATLPGCAVSRAPSANAPGRPAAAPESPSNPGSPGAGGNATSATPTASTPSSPYAPDSEDEPDDGAEGAETDSIPAPERPTTPRAPHPLDGFSRADIEKRLVEDPESIGSVSIGRPSAGALFNAVQMPKGDGWELVDPGNTWGTRETVDYLTRAIEAVRARYPDSHKVYIGHISAKHGGALRPHISHQSGRDVDLSYFYKDDSARWYRRATEANLDLPRTWAFVRALITECDVDLILIDHSLQKLIRDYALSIGENTQWISGLFDGTPGKLRPLIFHAAGHATHLHVRFFNPVAQETATRVQGLLARRGVTEVATSFVVHKAKKGETLGMLAKKYGTTVREIQRANGLTSTRIREKKEYRIPRRGKIEPTHPVVVPQRRLPRAARN